MASIYILHGGGPMPLLQKQQHKEMYAQFKQIHDKYPNPKGIIIFSAHWEETQWTILDHDNPPLYYDYSNFPPQAYNLPYQMSSSADLRNHVKEYLLDIGINLKTNTKRGYDHGVFIPMMIMYPDAKVPIIQISLLESLDPDAHFNMGVAMRGLKNQGFIILGSGSSCHGKFWEPQGVPMSESFDQELTTQIMGKTTEYDLLHISKNWRKLPYAIDMHPRQQHLAPLFVNLGTYEGKSKQHMKLFLMGLHLSNYVFE